MGMIYVGNKKETKRMARASAFIKLKKEILEKIKRNKMPKGNVLETARIAGITGAKKTSDLIPLCHNIEIDYVGVGFSFKKDGIFIESIVHSTSKTGVEMEALVSSVISALTIYDMCKMFDKSIEITKIELLEKRGGKSGVYKKY